MNQADKELVERLEEIAPQVAKRAMGGSASAPLISIPVKPTDVDMLMTEAAAAIRRLAGEVDELKEDLELEKRIVSEWRRAAQHYASELKDSRAKNWRLSRGNKEARELLEHLADDAYHHEDGDDRSITLDISIDRARAFLSPTKQQEKAKADG